MALSNDDQIFKIHADFCSALANEKRLKIMWLLAEGERSVGEIAQAIGTSVSNVSQQLRVLKDKGAVLEEKKGQYVYYRVSNLNFVEGCKLIRQGLYETNKLRSELFMPSKKSKSKT